MLLIDVTEESEDKLNRTTWRFLFIDDESLFVLQHYIVETRKTKRHKYWVDLSYDRTDKRESSCKLQDVPFSDDIRHEVMDKFISQLDVVKVWEPY